MMKAIARVQVTVEVEVLGPWSHDTKVEQIHHQACQDAEGALRRGLVIRSMTTGHDTKTVGRVVGDPKVIIVMLPTDLDSGGPAK